MKRIILSFICLFVCLFTYSQSINPYVIASSGGFFVSTNAQLSWTLGEVVTSTFTAGNSILTQGFQQNSYVYIGINESVLNSFKLKMYPNPTERYINLNWENMEQKELLVNISNYQGICVFEKLVNSNENELLIDLNDFTGSVFFIRVSSLNDDLNKVFKIIKS